MRVTVERATPDPELLVVRAARNDYRHEFIGDATDEDVIAEIQQDDESADEAIGRFLINTLMKKGHWGPMEHPQITFAVEGISRACMAQITRHRAGITFDIRSQRYVDFQGSDPEDLFVTPAAVEDLYAGNRDPDGTSVDDILDDYSRVAAHDEDSLQDAREGYFDMAMDSALVIYERLRDLGVPPEDARFVLPIASSVNMVVSMNLRTLLHIADMRAQANAQWEARELADAMLDKAEEWAPTVIGYYRDELIHRKNRLAP